MDLIPRTPVDAYDDATEPFPEFDVIVVTPDVLHALNAMHRAEKSELTGVLTWCGYPVHLVADERAVHVRMSVLSLFGDRVIAPRPADSKFPSCD